MVLWGVISAATAACNTFGGLLASRFWLGFVEAAYFVRITPAPRLIVIDYSLAGCAVLSELLVP
jgi:hypothetical protein